MIDLENLPTLPVGKALSKPQQYRALAFGVLGLIVIWLLILLARWTLTPVPSSEAAQPAGTFRPTADQLAGLTIKSAGTFNDSDQTVATGAIAADDTRGTPVFMPYGGQVTQVYVDAGAQVQRGQPLLKIRTPDFVDARNTLFAAAATQRTAAGALRIAEENNHRQEEIYKTAGGAFKDYRQSQSDLIAAQSALRSAESALGAARDKLAIFGKSPGEINRLEHVHEVSGIHVETTLHAPVGGLIASRAVSPGLVVSAGGSTPVFTITDPTHVWLIAQLTEDDAALVHIGDAVDVTTTAYPGRTFHAKIDNIAAALDPSTHRLPVRASIKNPDRALKPQMFASFIIKHNVTDPNALSIPSSAVIHEGDAARIWVALPNGLLQARTIKVGDSVAGMVKVLSGLKPGEKIVTGGAIFVNEAGTQQ
jgi:cobalt-zinc-cadmium efflux system membrane fusion protein